MSSGGVVGMDAVQVALLKGNQNSEAQGFNSGSGVWKFGKGFSSQDGHALLTFALRLEGPWELSPGFSLGRLHPTAAL
jgi:hypothetical protein